MSGLLGHRGLLMRSYADEVLADVPVMYLRCGATSGTAEPDLGSAAGGTNGTYSGGFTLNQPGLVAGGKSVKFGGVASPGKLAASSGFGSIQTYIPGGMAFEFVFKAEASGHGLNPFLANAVAYYAPTTQSFPIALRWDVSTSRVSLRLSTGADYVLQMDLFSGALDPSVAHHVVANYRPSPGLVELCVDGVVAASQTGINLGSGNPGTAIGRAATEGNGASSGESAFHGWVAEFAVYNDPLSAARVAAHYAAM